MTKKLSVAAAFAFSLVAVTSFVSPVCAATLPLAFATAAASSNGGGGVPGSVSNAGPPPQVANYQTFQSGGTASAGAFGVSATAYGSAAAQATEEYYFRVDGPQNGILIPLSLVSELAAIAENAGCSKTGCLYASASSNISFDNKVLAQRSSNPNELITFPPSKSVLSGVTQQIALVADVTTLDYNGIRGTFAQADSSLTITIDPAWLHANPGYSLEFSAGIDNSPFVAVAPLPAALPLFGTAIAGLGGAGWWKRRKVSA